MIKKIKSTIEELGLNYQKELLILLIINFALICLSTIGFIFLKQIIVLLAGLLLIVVFNYLYISRYGQMKNALEQNRENEFVYIIGYFQIFISDGFNVYQSFKSICSYSSSWMQDKINNLLKQIDSDKSVLPYIAFAKNFKNPIVNNVMLSIYQMVDEGESKIHMLQFTMLFDQISRNHQKELIDNKDKSLSSISIFPLVGSGATTVLLTFGIISIVGDMINVI